MFDYIKRKNVRAKLKKVETGLIDNVEESFPFIREMAVHIFGGGGKRIRPAFMILITDLLGYEGEDDVNAAIATEFIHTATLVHDDIIDRAVSRRNRKTVNSIWDENVSILFGDYIYARAIEMINSLNNHRLNSAFSRLTLGMIKGEILESDKNFKIDITYDEYYNIIAKKTGELFAGTGSAAAILGGLNEEDEKKFHEAGMKVGVAFQIIDDLFDFIGDESVLGKPVFSDLIEGKITLPALYLRDSDEAGSQIVESIIDEKGFKSVSEKQLEKAMEDRGIPDKVKKESEKLVREGLDLFKTIPVLNESLDLEKLVEYIINRNM
ncbi:MAG: polyprenyl synthetase family protein [Acidobacteria bacterium]|nr:polyprenyl synthetase family protein [Acidobacteriota bacterium]